MVLRTSTSIDPSLSTLQPPDTIASPIETIEETQRQDRERTSVGAPDPIQSNEFAATLVRAGVRNKFRELQRLMVSINTARPDIEAYGNGTIFRELIEEFGANDNDITIFDNQTLFGQTNQASPKNVVNQTRKALSRVRVAMSLIKESLVLANDIYDRVDDQVRGANSEYLSTDKRTENLLSWAYRVGAKLRPDLSGRLKVGTETRQTRIITDLYGLLNLMDGIILELQTLLNIPAYYRTATSSDTSQIETPVKVVHVLKNESLEELAFRELGDSDKASLIMEFNNLVPEDIFGEGWNGRALNIPYTDDGDIENLRYNFVLDAQRGIEAMGRDMANEIEAFGGDLVLLNYTDNFFQSLDNIIQTPAGAFPDDPDYGNRAIKLQDGAIPQTVGQMVATEFTRALLTNPRVLEVSNVTVVKDGAAVRVKYQITAVNHLTEALLTANLDQI